MHRHHHAITDALVELAEQATPVGQRRVLEALIDRVAGEDAPLRDIVRGNDTDYSRAFPEGQADGVR
jgi:hypothetical protein